LNDLLDFAEARDPELIQAWQNHLDSLSADAKKESWLRNRDKGFEY
jgi:hypothetical protein